MLKSWTPNIDSYIRIYATEMTCVMSRPSVQRNFKDETLSRTHDDNVAFMQLYDAQ